MTSLRTNSSILPTACILLLALLSGACAQPVPDRGNAVVIGTTRDFETVNELIALGSAFNDAIVDRLFLTLLEEQPDYAEHPPTFAPRLAESYEFSDDYKTLTFKLREDVTWSDGVPITAEDVRWTWQAQTDPEVAWNAGLLKEAISDVVVVDAHTVRFHFTEVSTSQLADANEGVILPKHAWSQLPFSEWRERADWFLENPISSGPFLFDSWSPRQQIELRRNDKYYLAGLPRLDRVIVRIVPDQANLTNQILVGTVDMIQSVAPADAVRIEESDVARLVPYETRQYTGICWNLLRPQFAEVAARQALAMAIDRQAIIDTVWRSYAKPGRSPIISSVWAHNDALEPWPYDPEGASRMLDDLGWIDRDGNGVREREGVAFSFELTTNPGNQERWDAMVMIREQLKTVGIEVKTRLLEYNTLNALNFAHDFDATVVGFYMDTTLNLDYAFHSGSIDDSYNYGSYSNPEVDRLIEESNRQADPANALPLLLRIQEILHEEQPFLFLWEPYRLAAVNKRLENVRPSPLDDFSNLQEWSLRTTE